MCVRVPTDRPESDGTFAWDATTIVVVEVAAGSRTGTGYTYTDASAGRIVHDVLWPVVAGLDALDNTRAWDAMRRAVRNIGACGVAGAAISAIDAALWDLKARLLGVSLVSLLGCRRAAVPVYGSGGFTSYSDDELADQLSGWVAEGIGQVKMKVGRDGARDPHRVGVARAAIGAAPRLFVDANGGYARKQALVLADAFAEGAGVTWFEEPVSSDDLEGLRLLRDRAPAGMEIAAGEYGYDVTYFKRMLDAGAVDVLQVDMTRAGGCTGLLAAAALADAAQLDVSGHCAPALHAPILASVGNLRHLEYFHDHVRIEERLFDGVAPMRGGALWPERDVMGNGLTFKRADAERYRI
jgi:L-alanine-DL-glutamate epimerase-like enolase superfamily enzyme